MLNNLQCGQIYTKIYKFYKLYDGLIWLKNSNKLYNNVEIVERFDKDYNIADIIIESNFIPTIPPGDVVPIVEKQFQQ